MEDSANLPDIGHLSLCGKLQSFRLFDLLTLLHLCRKTGTLQLRFGGFEATTFLRDGQLIFARTNQDRLRLGSVLSARNLITSTQESRIIALKETASEKFGQIAVRLGFINHDQLRDALKIQVSEIIYDALARIEGDFAFIDGMDLPDYAVTIAIDVPNLIMEGARRIDEWEQCIQLLPDETVVFRVVSQPEVQEKISLSLEEWRVLFRIDGRKPLRQIADESGLEPLHAYRIVYGLLASKLIEEVTIDLSAKKTQVQAVPAPSPVPAARTDRIRREVIEISDEEWREIQEDDTRLLVSQNASMSLRDISRIAVEVVRLHAELPGGEKRVIPLVFDAYVIGRERNCAIRFNDSVISAQHARLTRTGDGYIIEDLGSRNGTSVNHRPVQRHLLRHGDDIEIGNIRLEYRVGYDVT